ncbi:hypothetical protein Sme01_66970 [Sphaerisporangium melleum]|uniref:XRE family transcriptional regulator n=1 Tax=Sphaerisporangium melleum TaxID=321316 RepID=A0A917RHX4_9ACTN|nr:hypothetical protein [Sphaerisporangium melleum]GGL06703.1 hypothetical protein GCM10007964_56200 [Sphaerisporangium melleum]GII74221.1 hypothetical protein Sme01_66970 [Sphaerisporangium melleum]
MSGEAIQVLLECRRRSEALRAMGYGFEQIADVFAVYHEVSPLRVYRYTYGRTAAEAVALYNDLDPAGTAALRESRLYDYEHWPRRGMRPTARTVALFAQVYQTAARRLVTDEVYASYSLRDRQLIDRTDHRHLPAQQPSRAPSPVSQHVTMGVEAARDMVPAPTVQDCASLLRALRAEEADVKRRDLLFELALALGGAPAVILLRHLSAPEKDRLAAAVRSSTRVDSGTVEVIEKLTARCRRLDDDFGPETVLPIVNGQRRLVADLLRRETLLPGLRDRLTYAYAELNQLAGWLHHDLMDYAGAHRRYQEALTAAHEVADPTLISYLHTCLSGMSLHQGLVGEALDHIFAAQGWARQSVSTVLRSVHAMDLARALATAGRVRESEQALAQSRHFIDQPRSEADPSYLYWWSPNGVRKNTAFCMLAWGRPDDAIDAVERTLAAPITRKLARGEALLYYARALTQKREIPTAVDKIRGAAQITIGHSSGRLAESVRQARARLQPWADNKHVRLLDEELRSLGIIAGVSGLA